MCRLWFSTLVYNDLNMVRLALFNFYFFIIELQRYSDPPNDKCDKRIFLINYEN